MLTKLPIPTIAQLRLYSRHKINAGLDRQIRKLQATEELSADPEGFGDIESDFMNVHKSHKQHERELYMQREKVRNWSAKNKHFKVNLPNFLTYAEKEQIKLLNTQDPEEWTADKLSESFPADPETIDKIIKAKWAPRNEKRVRVHDQSAMRNWSLLKEGKFPEVNPTLREHIESFAKRSEEDLSNNKVLEQMFRPALPEPSGNEFSSIIKTCKKFQEIDPKEPAMISGGDNPFRQNADGKNCFSDDKKIPKLSLDCTQRPSDEETYLTDKIIDKRQMRLQDMKEIKMGIKTLPASLEVKSVELNNPAGTGVIDAVQKYATNEIVISEADRKKFEMSTIKERIYIPKKLRKRGATYKVEDCYYDDDGEFLYRVPGMTK